MAAHEDDFELAVAKKLTALLDRLLKCSRENRRAGEFERS